MTETPSPVSAQPIRPAATVILLRRRETGPEVLMGQRGSSAAFMPSKFVFPGGAVDPGDAAVPLASGLHPVCSARLRVPDGPDPATLAVAAIRELQEETGLLLGRPGTVPLPDGWDEFAARGLVPDAAGLTFVFRAITPPGRTRRFDARFFLADADAIVGNPDDLAGASGELTQLHWLPLSRTRSLDLPFITEVVLAEVSAQAACVGPPPPVPFFDNSGPVPAFRRIA